MMTTHGFLAASLLIATALPAQNQALSFTHGTSDEHVDVAYAPGLLPRRAITVEAWVTYDDSTIPSGSGFRWPTIARQDVAPGGESWFLRVAAASNNARSLQWACHNGSTLQSTSFTFTAGQLSSWTHVAATYDGQQAVLYLNGNPVAQRTVNGTLRDNMGVLRIGNGDVSTTGFEVWNGEIDEFRIWPFAKTQAEIQATMDEGLSTLPNVLTFNFDGTIDDSSSSFTGAPTAGIAFVPGAPNASVVNALALGFGSPSTTCSQLLRSTIPVRPTLGQTEFSFTVYDATPGATGAVFLSTNISTTPLSIVGIDLFLDTVTILPTSLAGVIDASGTGRGSLFIPNRPAVAGAALSGQWLLIDATCGLFGVTASQPIVINISN